MNLSFFNYFISHHLQLDMLRQKLRKKLRWNYAKWYNFVCSSIFPKQKGVNSDHFSKIATDESPIKNTQCQLSQQVVISNYTHAQLAFGTCKRDLNDGITCALFLGGFTLLLYNGAVWFLVCSSQMIILLHIVVFNWYLSLIFKSSCM